MKKAMAPQKTIHLSLFVAITFSLFSLPACKPSDRHATFTKEEKIILNLASRSEPGVEEAKEVIGVFNQVIEKKDIQLLLPYRSMLERQYYGDRADFEKISLHFSFACKNSLGEISESINCYKDDNCKYTPVGFLENPSDEKRFKYFLQLSRYHGRFIECSLEASKDIMKNKKDT
jgi:hypothetical protein